MRDPDQELFLNSSKSAWNSGFLPLFFAKNAMLGTVVERAFGDVACNAWRVFRAALLGNGYR